MFDDDAQQIAEIQLFLVDGLAGIDYGLIVHDGAHARTRVVDDGNH